MQGKGNEKQNQKIIISEKFQKQFSKKRIKSRNDTSKQYFNLIFLV